MRYKDGMDRWNEVRTAFAVARLGTVSAAAQELGLHRATVIRHIDALEESLGALADEEAIAQVNDSQDPFELAHKRLLIESQLREVSMRTEPALAAATASPLSPLSSLSYFKFPRKPAFPP